MNTSLLFVCIAIELPMKGPSVNQQCTSLFVIYVCFQFPEVIPLNVGGTHFTTRLSTLRRFDDTMLAAMFSGRHHIPRDAEGRFFIDRDGKYFG